MFYVCVHAHSQPHVHIYIPKVVQTQIHNRCLETMRGYDRCFLNRHVQCMLFVCKTACFLPSNGTDPRVVLFMATPFPCAITFSSWNVSHQAQIRSRVCVFVSVHVHVHAHVSCYVFVIVACECVFLFMCVRVNGYWGTPLPFLSS